MDWRDFLPERFWNGILECTISVRRSSSEERENAQNDSYLSDSFSTLSVSTSNIPDQFTNRMSQYSPRYIITEKFQYIFFIAGKNKHAPAPEIF